MMVTLMAKSSGKKKSGEIQAEGITSLGIEDSKKRIDEYEQSKPLQLSLFELLLPEEKKFSNTVELYDFIPKYHWGKAKRIEGEFLRALVREFECRGKRYKVKIDPAKITEADGQSRDYYPSKREELVEDALRKLACEGQGVFLDDAAGVTFTLYQLQKELQRNGHTYSNDQIKDALMICAKTHLTVTSDNNDTVLVSSIFETLGLQTREDWVGTGEKTRAFVRFNPLVTKGIKSGQFRQLNYEKSMRYKTVIARQLHKRMSHHYTQASFTNLYAISLSTIIRDFGLTAYGKLTLNLRDCLSALEEMKENHVILNYKVDKTVDAKNRNKLLEAKFTITPDPRFADEVMQTNIRQKQIALKSSE
jgi:hypothetical protein